MYSKFFLIKTTTLAIALMMIMCNNLSTNQPSDNIDNLSVTQFYADDQKVFVAPADSAYLIELRGMLLKTDGDENLYKKNEIIISYFAQALAKVLKHPSARALLKQEIDKRFDGDDEVLWKTIAQNTIDNRSISNILCDRISGNLISEDDFNSIPLLNIYLFNAKKWNGNTVPKVASCPIASDDVDWKTVSAWDCNLNKSEIDAWTPPSEPLFAIGLNERVDPQSGSLKKYINIDDFDVTASGPTPRISWYYIRDNQEPWTKGDAEIEFGFLTNSNQHLYKRFTNIKDHTWQRLGVPISLYSFSTYSVVMYEDDASGSQECQTINCGSFSYIFCFSNFTGDDDDFIAIKENISYGLYYYCATSPQPPSGSYILLGNESYASHCTY